MKNTLTLFAAMVLLLDTAQAQMKYIFEANSFLSEKETIPGGMIVTSHKIPSLSEHVLVTTLGTYEAKLEEHVSQVLRLYGGVGYANKTNTLAAGVNMGMKTHLDGTHIEPSYSFWAYAEKKRFAFTTIYIDWEAYLVELAYRTNKESAKWQIFALMANHGPNWGVAIKTYNPKSGFYIFAGPTIQWYKLHRNSSGEVNDASFNNPLGSEIGLHISLGLEFGHGKT